MKHVSLFTIAFLIFILPKAAQANEYSSELIVRLKPEAKFTSKLSSIINIKSVQQVETLSDDLSLYKISLKTDKAASAVSRLNFLKAQFESLKNNPLVKYVQPDHDVTQRVIEISPFVATPNDTNFALQWGLNQANGAHISALKAWNEFGVGGEDVNGHEIVVAIVDGGVDVTHNDLVNNIWINYNEVPADGIDNDNNGYVDDINGWNAFTSTGAINADMHGTHVAGIVGAVGNNGLGVVGVNWNVRIMGISGASSKTSVILKAYGYALAQKKLWLSSGGKLGAKVVATNSSFGVDYADCNSGDFPAWNDIYNELGAAGILSAVATANIAIDVDVEGDVPSACNSPYVVGVTNTTSSDKLSTIAGWGKTHIDIGAPGTQILSTIPGQQYRNLTGTSMATPHIAGAIAYLDAQLGKQSSVLKIEDPAEAALFIKQALIDTADPIADLQGKSVSGGRLNLFKAAAKVQ